MWLSYQPWVGGRVVWEEEHSPPINGRTGFKSQHQSLMWVKCVVGPLPIGHNFILVHKKKLNNTWPISAILTSCFVNNDALGI